MMTLSHSKQRLPQCSNEPWAIDIRNRYGSLQNLVRTFSVETQSYCDRNFEKAIAADIPTLVRLERAYGRDSIICLLKIHITSAIISMGEQDNIDTTDQQFIAQNILDSEKLRTLNLASVLAFFNRLRAGEIELFGKISPAKILQAFNKYAKQAIEREHQARASIRQRQRQEEYARHSAQAVTFHEYCALRGISAPNPLTPPQQ